MNMFGNRAGRRRRYKLQRAQPELVSAIYSGACRWWLAARHGARGVLLCIGWVRMGASRGIFKQIGMRVNAGGWVGWEWTLDGTSMRVSNQVALEHLQEKGVHDA